MKTFRLSSGKGMPVLGLGTWKSEPGEVGNAVKEALRLGYRHVDCAAIYGNEAEIGQALAECFDQGLVTRDELWITSKLWNDAHRPEDVVPALEKTLADLRLEALDLYLVHWPVALQKGVFFPESAADFIPLAEVPIAATWQGLEAAYDRGLCRHLGVSNFSVKKLAALLETARVRPEVNQVEMHPYLQQGELLDFCRANGVVVTAYSPLGSTDRPEVLKAEDEPILLEDPVIRQIAEERRATAAQVLLSWAIRRGTNPIPKSVHPRRLAENLAAVDVELGEADMRRIARLDRNRRYLDGAFWALEGSSYTLENLWDA